MKAHYKGQFIEQRMQAAHVIPWHFSKPGWRWYTGQVEHNSLQAAMVWIDNAEENAKATAEYNNNLAETEVKHCIG